MSDKVVSFQTIVRVGLPVVVFGLLLSQATESSAQLFRSRVPRVQANPDSQPTKGSWRIAQPNSQGVTGTPIAATNPTHQPADSGLGEMIRPSTPDQLPIENEIQTTDSRAGTPVPEHYYRGDWRRDPAYNPGYPNYPRYFGGFHSSHYYDLGIPNGDKGFRGNGIYWTPW